MSVATLLRSLADSSAADNELLARFRCHRDEAAFAALVRRHGPMVWGVCRRVAGEAADDAFQATFLVLLLRDPGGNLGGWLHGVALRTALKARRTARRRAARERVIGFVEPAARPEPAADWLPVLDEELAALADKYRLPVLLCDVQGRTLRAAAAELGIPVGTLSGRLAEGRRSLAGRLTRRGVGPMLVLAAVEPPAGLAADTVARAALVAWGGATVLPAVELSREVARAMFWTKWKTLAAATLVAAGGAVGVGGAMRADPPKPAAKPAADDWAARFAALNDGNWRPAFALGAEVADLPPERGWPVLRDNWPRVTSADARRQLVKAWYFHKTPDGRHHPHTLAVFHLSMTDPNPVGRDFANSYLKDVTLRDFAADGGFEEWYAANRDKPLAKAAADAAAEAVRGLVAVPPADLPKRLKFVGEHLSGHLADWPDSRKAVADAGLVPFLRGVVATGRRVPPPAGQQFAKPPEGDPGPEEMAAVAVGLLAALRLPEADAQADFLPLLDLKVSEKVRSAAVRALGREGKGWAVGPLLDQLVAESGRPDQRSQLWGLATALAEVGDPRAIPTMIAVIARDDTYDTVYGVGYFGLGKLTGVQYDESHKGAWWKDWWARSKAKFPPAVRDLTIPEVPKVAKPPADAAELPSAARSVGDRKYVLIGSTAAPPAAGFKLLVVLPGGDGGEGFGPFVRDLRREALGDGWLVAQAVAEDRVVWPTVKLNPPADLTETYLAAVVADAANAAKVDPAHVYLLGWSSGGPASYAALLAEGSPFRGAVVAMSVFKPGLLPPLGGAKGKGVYLLQSPDDTVTAMRWAVAAKTQLGAAGARVKLAKYAGGHGWHGDVFGQVRAGVEWLSGR